MAKDMEINVQEIIKYFKELVGAQAEEIAILRATVDALNSKDKVE
jgi:hypothetical protein